MTLNWTAFEKYGLPEGPLTEQRKKKLSRAKITWYSSSNPWKYADGFFGKVKLTDKLLSLLRRLVPP